MEAGDKKKIKEQLQVKGWEAGAVSRRLRQLAMKAFADYYKVHPLSVQKARADMPPARQSIGWECLGATKKVLARLCKALEDELWLKLRKPPSELTSRFWAAPRWEAER